MSTASLREMIDDCLDADGSKIPNAWLIADEKLNQWAVKAFLSIISTTITPKLFVALACLFCYVLGICKIVVWCEEYWFVSLFIVILAIF